MKIFISGPMTGIQNFNFDEFNKKAKIFSEQGWEVVNPVNICLKYEVKKVLADRNLFNKMINEELDQLRTCDAIYMMKGYEFSQGAMKEYAVAKRIGLDFYFEENGIWKAIVRAIRDWAFEI